MKFLIVDRYPETDYYIINSDEVDYFIIESLDELEIGSYIIGSVEHELFFSLDGEELTIENFEETGTIQNSIRILRSYFEQE